MILQDPELCIEGDDDEGPGGCWLSALEMPISCIIYALTGLLTLLRLKFTPRH